MNVLTNLEHWNELCERNDEEKEIVEVLELVEEYYWDQRAHIVLCVVLSVRGKAARRSPTFECQRPPLPRYNTSAAPPHSVAERQAIAWYLLLDNQGLILISAAIMACLRQAFRWLFLDLLHAT